LIGRHAVSATQILLAVVEVNGGVLVVALLAMYWLNRAVRPSGL
jgi:hypothetical protein